MATPPTFIAEHEGASWDNGTSPKTTSSFDSAVGDVWVVGGIAEAEGGTFSTPTNTGTAQAFSARGSVDQSNYSEVRTYTAVVADVLTAQTVSHAYTSGGLSYGMNTVRFSGSSGIGAVPAGESETNNTAPSVNITTTGDNSAVVVFVGDWNAADGASRTWLTVNSITPTAGNGFELTYFRNAAKYAVYVGYYPDVGAAGSKTVGLSAPTTMKAAIVAIEVKGIATTDADANQASKQRPFPPWMPPWIDPATIPMQMRGDRATPVDAVVAAATITTSTAVPAPTVQTGSTVAATEVATLAALPAPAVQAGAVVAANAIVTTIALPPPTLQTGSTVAATAIATTAALPAPTVSTSNDATVSATVIATVAALPAPSLATDQTVSAVAIATTTGIPAPSISTGGGVTYSSHVTLAAARNGTNTHTVHPDGTGGTTVDGSTFTPTSGRFLICLAEGPVTSTTPTGWTLPANGSAINNSGLYVWHRTADGTSADQVATTHNGSNYPVVFDFYEFPAGYTFAGAATATGVSASGGAGPTLSGLTGTNWTAGAVGQNNQNGAATNVTAWDLGTEEVDTSVDNTGGTDGYLYGLTHTADNTASSAAYAATSSDVSVTVERLVIAVGEASGDATVTAVAIATTAALPAPALQTGCTVSAVAVATTVAVPAPTVSTSDNATVSAVAIATVSALPAPTVSASAVADPYQAGPQVAWMFARPDQASFQLSGDASSGPPPASDATVTPAAVATVVAMPAPALQTGSTVAATSITTVTALPAPSIQTAGNATVQPSSIATVTALPAPSLQTGSRVNPATVATVTSITAPTVSTVTDATISASSIATVTALPVPTLKTGSTVSATTVATVIAMPAPVVDSNVFTGIKGHGHGHGASSTTGNAYPRTSGGIIGRAG